MDTSNPNQVPQSPTPISSVSGEFKPKRSSGPLISVVVILLLIIVGGMYFLGQRMNRDYSVPTADLEADQISESLRLQSTSDDLDSIEADLNATDLDNMDQGAALIEAEI